MRSDDCDLKLSQIFRTPKDFSKVNFDHFEILERNNFQDAPEKPEESASGRIYEATPGTPKSIANAQIMLRFGGDDILGRNYLGTAGKVISKPIYHYNPTIRHGYQYSDQRHPHLPYYAVDPYSGPRQELSVSPQPYYPPHYSYPPYSFPGVYYNSLPQHGYHYSAIPNRNGKFLNT